MAETTEVAIAAVLDELEGKLVEAFRRYGDIFLKVGMFRADAALRYYNSIRQFRMLQNDENGDSSLELLGCLVLMRVVRRLKEERAVRR